MWFIGEYSAISTRDDRRKITVLKILLILREIKRFFEGKQYRVS